MRMEAPKTATDELIDELRATFLFEAFDDEQLRWVVANTEVVRLPAGTVLFTENATPDAFWVLLDGALQLSHPAEGRRIVLETADVPGTWGGWMPAFEERPLPLSFTLTVDSRLLRVPKASLRHMLDGGYPLTNHLLAGISTGSRRLNEQIVQQEKLAALGRLAAGLAHELNNPAAAARRAASSLQEALRERDRRAVCLVQMLDEQQVRANLALAKEVADRPPLALAPLAKSDLEEEIAAWLEERGIEDGYPMAASFIDASIGLDDLAAMAARVPPATLADALSWLEATTIADELAREITVSVGRISDLVGAIKSYTFMDRDGESEIDVHTGIEDTLTILGYKLRKANVEVVREFATDLPKITTQGSALNQVWTNLIDNALDAMAAGGRLTIRTGRRGTELVVAICDTGPGVPADVAGRVFDPFFTTKPIGQGTGMGLDIARRIVREHGGDIGLRSEPGDTRFDVHLPIRDGNGSPAPAADDGRLG